MKLFITGATGLVGRRLVIDRLERGDEVLVLSRRAATAGRLFAADANPRIIVVEGDPARPGPWQKSVDGCDAVIHLAGAGVADRRWTRNYKALIASSRIDGTRQVVAAIGAARHRPRVLINASAVGFYSDTGDRITDESSGPGDDFLAGVSVQWEREATAAEKVGTRVVLLRTGVVLDDRGGALPRMALPFRLFVGGPVGNGRQFVPWIHWRDVIGLIDLALRDPAISGPLNMVSPNAVTARELARSIGRALHRPCWAPAPWLALRLAVGELANVLVMSQRVVPLVAIRHGFQFACPRLDPALENLLQPSSSGGGSKSAGSRSTSTSSQDVAPSAQIRLLAIDVDGTLLTSSERLSPTVVQACRAAERAGCRIVLATGRPPRAVRAILQSLATDSLVIAHHGALIWNPRAESADHHQPLDSAMVRQIIELARSIEPDLLIGIETIDRWGTDRFDPAFRTDTSRLMPPDRIAPLDELLAGPITKLNLLREPARVQRVLAAVREEFGAQGAIHIHFTNPHLIQVTDWQADKGSALEIMAGRMGISRESVMAIGDAINDLGMIEWAGLGVALANADPAVRDAADVVVESNDEHGVAFAIQRYVLNHANVR